MGMRGIKSRVGLALKTAVSVGLLLLILGQVDADALVIQLSALAPAAWATAVVAMLLLTVLQGWRWWFILHSLGSGLPRGWTLRTTLMALLFNQALPGTVGGDAYRIVGSVRLGIGLRKAIGGVTIDRVSGVAGLGLLAVCGLPAFIALDGAAVLTAGVIMVETAVMAAIGLLLGLHLVPTVRMPGPVRGMLDVSRDAWSLARRPGTMTVLLTTSVVNHLIFIILFYGLALALGVSASLVDALVLVPPIMLVSLLPVSIAGWGVREGATAAGFALIGTPPDLAVSLSVAVGLVLLVAGLAAGAMAAVWGGLAGDGEVSLSRGSEGP